MSDFTVSYPRPDDVDRYRDALGLPREAIVRDIVRMVSIGQMAYTGELSDEWVLAAQIRFAGAGITKQEAIQVVRTKALPALYGKAGPPAKGP